MEEEPISKIAIQPYHIGTNLINKILDNVGVLEELINALSVFPLLHVASKTTSLYLQKNPLPIHLLKENHNLDAILEGGIKLVEGEFMMSSRLISTKSESILFSQKINFNIDELESVLQQTAKAIYESIRQNFSSNSLNLKVVESQEKTYYLKGMYHWKRYTYKELNLAINYFKKAIQFDENYAQAYAALADCYCVIGVMGFDEPKTALLKAKTFVKKALQLNDKRSESFVSAALIDMFLDRNYSQAKINLKQALLLNETNLKVHHTYAMFFLHTDDVLQAEKNALYTIKKAPSDIPYYDMLAKIYMYKKDFNKGLSLVEKALVIDENSIELKELEGHLNMHLGNYEKAIECYQVCLHKNPNHPLYHSNLAYIFSKSNYHFDSRKSADNMEKIALSTKNKGTFHYAQSIIKLGQLDYKGFFYHINIALKKGLGMFIGELICNPIYNEVRKDKRYRLLLRKLHLDTIQTEKIKKRSPSSSITIFTNTKENFILDPQEIAFIESHGNYSKIYWFENDILKNKLLRITLSSLEKQFGSLMYIVRCHKSYLINMNEPLMVSGNSKSYFFESKYYPICIPISRAKANSILNTYHNFLK